MGLVFFLLGVVVALVDGGGFGRSPAGRLLFGGACGVAGFLSLLGARLSWQIRRARPKLLIESDGFTINHPGLLRLPLFVPRSVVAELCAGDCQANVLVVLRQAFDLDGLPRRGPPSVVRVSSQWSIYKGPRRSALIHGLLFGVASLDQLRDGFASWGALVREPSDAALAWISLAQLRSDATGGETRGWK